MTDAASGEAVGTWLRLGEWSQQRVPGLSLSSAQARALASRLSREGKLVVRELRVGLEIESSSFVGRVSLGDLTVTVEPKLAPDALFSLFRYAYGLSALAIFGETGFSPSGSLFPDLVIAELVAEASALVRRGLVRRYRLRDERLSSPRGRIAFARLAAAGGSVDGTLPCRHHVRSEDWLLNRALLAGMTLARELTREASLRQPLGRLCEGLAGRVSPAPLSARLIARARASVDRMTAPYAPSLQLIELLLGGAGVSLGDDRESARLPGFLFDMNRFFQALVGRFLRENLPSYVLEEEHALDDLLRYSPAQNPRNQRAPRPRPDFALHAGGRLVAFLDVKYRDLWERSLPREMLYQLALYAAAEGQKATILYPTTEASAREARVEIRDAGGPWGARFVVLRPVHLPTLEAHIRSPGEASRRHAESLALG